MTREKLLAWLDSEITNSAELGEAGDAKNWGYEEGILISRNEAEEIRTYLSLPPAEGAEEILASLVESLGEPIKIHNHIYEIRPYTVESKTEWWMFHKGVGSGEPLAQWLNKFATLHAQQLAEKMVKIDALLNRAAGLVGNPGANISSSCDIACIDWQKDYDEYLKSKEQ